MDHQTITAPRHPCVVTHRLREGLLQDLIAVDIMVRTAQAQLAAEGASMPILGLAAATLDRDLDQMRSAIREIEAAVAAA